MVDRAKPLIVNILVTALASVRLHEITTWDAALMGRLRGTREEKPCRPISFLVHGCGWRGRIRKLVGTGPHFLAEAPSAISSSRPNRQTQNHRSQ